MKNQEISYHTYSVNETIKALESDSSRGLTTAQVNERVNKYGPNTIESVNQKSIFKIVLEQLIDFMVIILIVAAIISFALGEATDSLVIIFIVILNTIIGATQEWRSQKAVEALNNMSLPSLVVKRDGHLETLSHDKLVPGDIVMLETGNMIPADIRLLSSVGMQIDESSITGESLPVEKVTDKLEKENLVLGDRFNMAFKGTIITMGHGTGIITATGMRTEIGKMAEMIHRAPVLKTPLQIRLAGFGKRLTLLLLGICSLILVFGLLQGKPFFQMFMTVVSLAVAAIPEALPAVVTISLAFGAKRMVKSHALIRNLPAVETLGSVTYICSDKTGTLTQNKMHVEEVWPEEKALDQQVLHAMALCNDSTHDGNKVFGEPTEAAMYNYALGHGMSRHEIEEEWPRIDEIPFSSERKMMTTIHEKNGEKIAYTKGAPEKLIPLCEPAFAQDILRKAEELASQGIRVLALATRKLNENIPKERIENHLKFLALVGLLDPPREEVYESIKDCKGAGIKTVMITGDHLTTAKVIAKKLGMIEEDNHDEYITGEQLYALSDESFSEQVEKIRLYARTSPEQKINIVKALQSKGHFVAMTGDGVNDAPALKKADIGVAMGINGSDVSKESSDLILLDDNFSSIVNAVGEGRRIYDNIKKFIRYTLTSNTGEIVTILFAPLFGIPIPLLPIHILWVNLLTDGLPGIALTNETPEGDILKRPPRNPSEPLFNIKSTMRILTGGFLLGFATLIVAWYAWKNAMPYRTMAFTVLVFGQFGICLSLRRNRSFALGKTLFSNIPLMLILIGSVVLHFGMIYTPFVAKLFYLKPLSLYQIIICLAAAVIVLFLSEIEKFCHNNLAKDQFF